MPLAVVSFMDESSYNNPLLVSALQGYPSPSTVPGSGNWYARPSLELLTAADVQVQVLSLMLTHAILGQHAVFLPEPTTFDQVCSNESSSGNVTLNLDIWYPGTPITSLFRASPEFPGPFLGRELSAVLFGDSPILSQATVNPGLLLMEALNEDMPVDVEGSDDGGHEGSPTESEMWRWLELPPQAGNPLGQQNHGGEGGGGGGRGVGGRGAGGGGGTGQSCPSRGGAMFHDIDCIQGQGHRANAWVQDHAPDDDVVNELLNGDNDDGNCSEPEGTLGGDEDPLESEELALAPLILVNHVLIKALQPTRRNRTKRAKKVAKPQDILEVLCGQALKADYQNFFNGINDMPQGAGLIDKMLHFAHACQATEQTEILVNLVYYLNAMKFASLVQWIKPQLLQVDTSSVGVISRFICYPTVISLKDSNPLGRMVKNTIIPAIAFLREKYPIRMTTFFPVMFLQMLYTTEDVDCTDFEKMDAIMDNFGIFNDFIKLRDWTSWASCLSKVTHPAKSINLLNTGMFTPLTFSASMVAAARVSDGRETQEMSDTLATPASHCSSGGYLPTPPRDMPSALPSSPPGNLMESSSTDSDELQLSLPDWKAHMSHPKLTTFKVNFKPKLSYNLKTLYPKDPLEHFHYTEKERELAGKVSWVCDLADLQRKLKAQLKRGHRTNCQTYLAFDTETLSDKLEIILARKLKYMDTKAEGFANTFDALHGKWYDKFAVDGHGTLAYADPSTLHRDGCRPVNSCLNVLHFSQEAKDNPEVYQMLVEALEPVFTWIQEQLRILLPDVYIELEVSVNHLPNCGTTPVYPFAGFVLNINVSTRIHCDVGTNISASFLLSSLIV
ncbi:hypothetical protein CPB84DRAFT_1852209 [Gymnopilus junonius]|uniref:Uncharacterized protein n=1 Tax=Gymnopilus junonius TaxID=109634 RepID=A0A9P5NEK7_GYMJU|nr:hypothetical protein CPB84DRAFT_1852209 [Gymnopilus junonius]